MPKKIILFTLQTFSTTGGIQKMTRTLSHALYLLAGRHNWEFKLWSAYDYNSNLMEQYVPAKDFKGFGVNRIKFVLRTILEARKPDVVIISHVNLSIIGLMVKMLNPGCKVWLIAHGIEVWRPLSFLKRMFLKYCDKVICVSKFTSDQVIQRHGVDAGKCFVLNNAVDPFIKLPDEFVKPERLLKKYRIDNTQPVIFTLTRLASSEQYKGHDQVIKAIKNLKLKYPGIKYILAGQYDHNEEIRIQKLISSNEVDKEVILTGFIEENELSEYFLLADIFVLPSKKEGFGIVFIEALACGLPVICGNADGSVDAICNGELGTAINADNVDELENALAHYLDNPLTATDRKMLQNQCLQHFNEADYITNLEKLIVNE
jgi:glycosyltransferase involved in cell wall biosynthesis